MIPTVCGSWHRNSNTRCIEFSIAFSLSLFNTPFSGCSHWQSSTTLQRKVKGKHFFWYKRITKQHHTSLGEASEGWFQKMRVSLFIKVLFQSWTTFLKSHVTWTTLWLFFLDYLMITGSNSILQMTDSSYTHCVISWCPWEALFLEMESDKMGAEFSTKISALYIRIAKLFGLKGGW